MVSEFGTHMTVKQKIVYSNIIVFSQLVSLPS